MAKRITTSNITYKITLDSLANVIDKIKDLTKLDKRVLLKFDNNDLLLYSMVGKNNGIHGFKNHILKIKDIFSSIKGEIEEDNLKYSIEDAKRFVTSIIVFVKYMKSQGIEDELTFKLTYNDDNFVEKLLIQNKKSKEETMGGDPSCFTQAIDIEQINDAMDIDQSEYSFSLKKEDFDYIKSKTIIEKDNDILYLNVKDNKINIGENRWEHNICDIEGVEDTTISFPKRYFKCINYDNTNEMILYVFDTFILVKGDNTNLMIAIELTL